MNKNQEYQLPIDMGYVSLLENSRGYFTITVPINTVRQAGWEPSTSFQVTYNPSNKSLTYIPKKPKKGR